MVHYDDSFKKHFGANAVTRVEAIMAIVDEMYSEKDTLDTEIEVNVVGIENAEGSNWDPADADWYTLLPDYASQGSDLISIAKESSKEANLYVFLTWSSDESALLGLGYMGVVCDASRDMRITINRYAAGTTKGGDAYTAEV